VLPVDATKVVRGQYAGYRVDKHPSDVSTVTNTVQVDLPCGPVPVKYNYIFNSVEHQTVARSNLQTMRTRLREVGQLLGSTINHPDHG